MACFHQSHGELESPLTAFKHAARYFAVYPSRAVGYFQLLGGSAISTAHLINTAQSDLSDHLASFVALLRTSRTFRSVITSALCGNGAMAYFLAARYKRSP